MITLPRNLSALLFWFAVAAGLTPQDGDSVWETVVLTVTASGVFQAYSGIPGSIAQVVSPLPSLNNRALPSQACRSWQCYSPVVNFIPKDSGAVVLTQLQNGIGLAEFLYNTTHLWITSANVLNLNQFLPHRTSPSDLFDIVYVAGGYTVYASQSNTLFSCDFSTNFTDLSGSHFTCNGLDSVDPIFQSSLASNFVAIDNERVLFAYSGSLYAANYLSHSISYVTSLQGALCKRLSYSRNMAYLYCDSNQALTVNLNAEPPEVNVHYLNDSGIPFNCTHAPDVFTVAVKPNHTQVNYRGQTFRTGSRNFYNGQCIVDSQNTLLFYFIDHFSGLYVVNTSSSTVQHVPEACNDTNTCVGLYLFPGLNAVILRRGSPGELLVYNENLEVVRQQELSIGVAGVSLYTICRPVTPITMPSERLTTVSGLMTTAVLIEEPGSTGTPEGTATPGPEVTDVALATIMGPEVTVARPTTFLRLEVTAAKSSLPRPAVIGIAVAAAIVLIAIVIGIIAFVILCLYLKGRVSLTSVAHKMKTRYCTSQTGPKSKGDSNKDTLELKQTVVQDSSTVHCGSSMLVPDIPCKKEGGACEQVIATQEQGLAKSSCCTKSSMRPSISQETSALQQLKSDDAKHGYPESDPITPLNCKS